MVFARVRSPLEIPVAVARTSQSPFPLAVMLQETAFQTKYEKFIYNIYYFFFLDLL